MRFKFDEEVRAKAVRAGMRNGGICRAAAYCSLMYGSDLDSGFVLLTDYSFKMVSVNIYDTLKIKDTFEIPYNRISDISYHQGLYGRQIVKFKFNGYSYKLILFKYSKIPYQIENMNIIVQFFANLKNMQRAS